jgi:5-amino-6-(5-phosphoribosylamino)uracil reductase
MAPSLDGKIAPAHAHRQKSAPFVMSRHPEDPKRMHALRLRADAVLIGASNLRKDDPDLMPSRLRAVVTRAGEGIEPTAKMFDPTLGGEAVIAHAGSMPAAKRAAFAGRATLLELGATEVDLAALLEWMARERGCQVVLSEGGGVLNAQLLAARAIDELFMTLVPRILGGADAPTSVEGPGFAPDALPDARLADVDRVGDELFLHYTLEWK